MGTTKLNFFLRIPVPHQRYAVPHRKAREATLTKFSVSLSFDDAWEGVWVWRGERVIQVGELIRRCFWAETELMQREEKLSSTARLGIFFSAVTQKVRSLLS
jgi:hypothetical protein